METMGLTGEWRNLILQAQASRQENAREEQRRQSIADKLQANFASERVVEKGPWDRLDPRDSSSDEEFPSLSGSRRRPDPGASRDIRKNPELPTPDSRLDVDVDMDGDEGRWYSDLPEETLVLYCATCNLIFQNKGNGLHEEDPVCTCRSVRLRIKLRLARKLRAGVSEHHRARKAGVAGPRDHASPRSSKQAVTTSTGTDPITF